MSRPGGTPLDSLSVNNELGPFHCLADTLKGDQLKANWIKRILVVSSFFFKGHRNWISSKRTYVWFNIGVQVGGQDAVPGLLTWFQDNMILVPCIWWSVSCFGLVSVCKLPWMWCGCYNYIAGVCSEFRSLITECSQCNMKSTHL